MVTFLDDDTQESEISFLKRKSEVFEAYQMECQALKTQIYHKTKLLIQQGHKVSVCWVPSHSGLEGMKRPMQLRKRLLWREELKQLNGQA